MRKRTLFLAGAVLCAAGAVAAQSFDPQYYPFGVTPDDDATITVYQNGKPWRATIGGVRGSSTLLWTTKATDYTITTGDNGAAFHNLGAAGTVTYTLPAIGSNKLGYCMAAFADAKTMNITAQPGAIIMHGNQSLNSVQATDSFGMLCLRSITSTTWGVVSVTGNWNFLDPYQYAVAVNGAAVSFGQGTKAMVLDPAAGIATFTVILPASPTDGWAVKVMSSQAIAALTVNPAGAETVKAGATALAANAGASWRYRLANTTWYRQY